MAIFVSREEWGSSGQGGRYIGAHSEYAVLHHTPNQDGLGHYETALAEMYDIEAGHMAQGWGGVGYTYVISGPYAFEGRGYGQSGAHAPGANSNSVGMAFLLDARYRAPTAEEWNTAAAVAQRGVDKSWLIPNFATTGHRDWVATECPAHHIYIDLSHLRTAMNGGVIVQPEPIIVVPKSRSERSQSMEPVLRKNLDGSVNKFDWDLGGMRKCVAYDFPILPIGWKVAVHSAVHDLDNWTGQRWAQLVWRNGRGGVAGFWHGTQCTLGPSVHDVMHTVVVPAELEGKLVIRAVYMGS